MRVLKRLQVQSYLHHTPTYNALEPRCRWSHRLQLVKEKEILLVVSSSKERTSLCAQEGKNARRFLHWSPCPELKTRG